MLDLDRMRRERRIRLALTMEANGLDGLLLLGPSNQLYLGVGQPNGDAGRIHQEGAVTMWTGGRDLPFVWTRTPECVARDIPTEHVFPPLATDCAEGMPALARAILEVLAGARRIGVDEFTAPMMELGRMLPGVELCDAGPTLTAARVIKTTDEIECLRTAQALNEAAMVDVYAALRPGVRQNELSAILLRRAFELGIENSFVDPIWTIVPRSLAAAPATIFGEVPFPQATSDRFIREGDIVMSDTGFSWNGYHSDFGKTWICSNDPRPSPELRACYDRWCEVMDRVYSVLRPGATSGDLVRAAASLEKKHALSQFYLAHGVGLSSAELPFVGTDLGIDYDDAVVLAPGMVLVFEPVIWREGAGGYRSEELICITESGFERLSRYGYEPFQ